MPMIRIPRNATRLDERTDNRETRTLSEWQSLDAYVLLGDPGAGKSWAFEDECMAVAGVSLSARDVVAGIAPANLAGRTVFIDGLDEVRAGTTDGRVPFDAIRKWLHERNHPRFRLSCREADWLGSSDIEQIRKVAPGEKISVLHLEPLLDSDITTILASRANEVHDAHAFLLAAERTGLTELLRNPLLLDLMIKATAGGSSPKTRAGIYEAACRQLVIEHNIEHLSAKPPLAGDIDRLLDDAGMLCAIILLSGKRGIARRGTVPSDMVALSELPAIAWHNAEASLSSKVFAADIESAVPRHRSIAEYLAGRTLARRIERGLPVGRVLALMQGIDGVPLEPLRGLCAWLAVHHIPSRACLISLDPMGFVLNGDAASLCADERIGVLHALRSAAEKDPWFRNAVWVSHPFGSLATADMASTYEALLRNPKRDHSYYSFIECVFDALLHGEPMPSLPPALEGWIEDGSAASHLRVAAYKAWKKCADSPASKAWRWLQAIESGAMPDSDDELCGALLTDLYPTHVTPALVFDYWHAPKQNHLTGMYRLFWDRTLWAQTPQGGLAILAEGWLRRQETIKTIDLDEGDSAASIPSKLLIAVLENAGDHATDTELYDWLGLCLDKYGFSRLEDQEHIVRDWLAKRPDRMKAVMAIGLSRTRPDANGHWAFWEAESRLHGAPRPRDWLFWLLDQASTSRTPELVNFCFVHAAHAATEQMPGVDSPSMEQIEAWVKAHKTRWPDSEQWLESTWSMPLDHWKGDQIRRQQQTRAQHYQKTEQRRRNLEPLIPSLLEGAAPLGLLYEVAIAHEHGFIDVPGETPLDRVRNYLVSDEATAQKVIAALRYVLDRTDLPTVDDAIALEAQNKQHLVRPAALLGARLVYEHDANAVITWSQALAERLTAYYLTDGTGEMPGWYRTLVKHRPDWVAPVLVEYAKPKFKRKGAQHFAGLWALGREPDHIELTRLAVPLLLKAFPLRASEAARGTLNRFLLQALPSLDRDQAAALVGMKLSQRAMDHAQRISWLVADMPYRAEAAKDLASLVGRNKRRAIILGIALHDQDSLTRMAPRLKPSSIQQLIEILAPITEPNSWHRDGIVTVTHHRGDTVRALFSILSSDPSAEAREALLELGQTKSMHAWNDMLRYNLRTQAVVTREASYHTPNPVEVAHTLTNLAPANPADLRTLVVQHLTDLQAQWRGADTFALKLFWRDAGHVPKVENDCRDLLLERLRERLLPLNILVGREHSAAQDKRVDQCVEFMRDGLHISLPIEVKKEDHVQLWTAWHDQLQRLYTISPNAQGYGLYLVLWFGIKVTPTTSGIKLHSAEELHTALEHCIPASDRHRLAVQVLDLSWPEPSVRPSRNRIATAP